MYDTNFNNIFIFVIIVYYPLLSNSISYIRTSIFIENLTNLYIYFLHILGNIVRSYFVIIKNPGK